MNKAKIDYEALKQEIKAEILSEINGKNSDNYIRDFDELKNQINKILESSDNFSEYVNTRDYENKVSDIAGKVIFDKDYIEIIEKTIADSKDSNFSFTLFFVLFTWLKRNSYGSIRELYEKYYEKFKQFELFKHIEGMMVLRTSNDTSEINKAIKKIDKLIDESGFSAHIGVLNCYVELVCTYCELKFDERDDDKTADLLKKASKINNDTIEIDKKGKEYAYSKFYLNKGRILVLQRKYNEGEKYIKFAISILPDSADRNVQVNSYSQYLAKSSMMRAYDSNDEKFKELERFKSDSNKSITLITSVIGFLLGAINIFTTVEDPFTLLMLMVGYCGLVLMLAGIVLLGFALNSKERKKKFIAFDIVIPTVGVILFAIALTIVILKKDGIIF